MFIEISFCRKLKKFEPKILLQKSFFHKLKMFGIFYVICIFLKHLKKYL